jgi:hypothetical protein
MTLPHNGNERPSKKWSDSVLLTGRKKGAKKSRHFRKRNVNTQLNKNVRTHPA